MALFKTKSVFLEFGNDSLKVLEDDGGFELPLERGENGRLTASTRDQVAAALTRFFKRGMGASIRAYCAIGARGVSLRRLTLPACRKEDLPQVLRLQIEREFPLSPDELAWGYCSAQPGNAAQSGMEQELIVAAVKKEIIDEYSLALSSAGIAPVFTLGIHAASHLGPRDRSAFAVLDVRRQHSELLCIENGAPASLRIIPVGGEQVTLAIEQALGLSREAAEELQSKLASPDADREPQLQKARQAARGVVTLLAQSIHRNWTGQGIQITGRSARLKEFPGWLAEELGPGARCERIEFPSGEGRSAATLGLKRLVEQDGAVPSLTFQIQNVQQSEASAATAPWGWAALAAVLAVALVSLRYVEPVLKRPGLERRLKQVQKEKERLPEIDRKLTFLQNLKESQPAYLNVIATLAAASPGGMQFEALSINRRGDLSLRTSSLRDPQQATAFRTKLIESGYFSSVVVEEQTPTPDRQKLIIRISARLKPTKDLPPDKPPKHAATEPAKSAAAPKT